LDIIKLLFLRFRLLLAVETTFLVMEIEDFGVHHNLPCVNRQISVVEAPIELLLGHRLVGRVMVWRKVLVLECLGCRDALLGIEDEHALEEVDSGRFGILEPILERLPLALGE